MLALKKFGLVCGANCTRPRSSTALSPEPLDHGSRISGLRLVGSAEGIRGGFAALRVQGLKLCTSAFKRTQEKHFFFGQLTVLGMFRPPMTFVFKVVTLGWPP